MADSARWEPSFSLVSHWKPLQGEHLCLPPSFPYTHLFPWAQTPPSRHKGALSIWCASVWHSLWPACPRYDTLFTVPTETHQRVFCLSPNSQLVSVSKCCVIASISSSDNTNPGLLASSLLTLSRPRPPSQ